MKELLPVLTLSCFAVRQVWLKKQNCRIALLTGLTTVLLSNPFVVAQDLNLHQGIVTSFKLNIRKAPSLKSDVVVVVKQGDILNIHGRQGKIGSWIAVSYQGNQGYVRNRPRYIKFIQTRKKKSRKAQKERQNITAKIETQSKMVESFSQKEIEIIEGLNEIDFSLNNARIKIATLSDKIMHLEKEIEQLKEKRQKLGREIDLNRDYAGQRLRALYKMNMIGRLDATGVPVSVFDFFLRQNSMKQIIKSDFQTLDKQNIDLEKFEALEQKLQSQISEITTLETQLQDQIRMNKKESVKRQRVLQQIRQKKRLSLAAVESLKYAALKLDNKITAMQTSSRQFIGSDFSFSNYKGRLNTPVKGKIVSKYGPLRTGEYKSFSFQKGIDIKVERGEPVKSVFKGEVMFAQWLKGYGNLLIINHGDSYYTLYAHVEEIFKQKGENVDTGEVIATAGDTGSIKGVVLHFEIRHHGKPVNPMKWLKKGA